MTGIRPLRLPEVRAEKEVIDGQKVVHAYGTTAGGYIYSFGLARVIAKLVDDLDFETDPSTSTPAPIEVIEEKPVETSPKAADNSLVVQSKDIFYGLPTFPEDSSPKNLVALVTGATGVSGYHMVKVLAASPRWTKIYCTSSRPPPENFFTDLGEGAKKVEHLRVNFLSEPQEIAGVLQKIDQVYVFRAFTVVAHC